MATPSSKPSPPTVIIPPVSAYTDAKAIPAASHPTAHKAGEHQHESHEHINADLYRTFSPSDVAMWDWRAEWQRSTAANSSASTANSGTGTTSSGLWSKIFGFGKSTS